MSRLQTILLCCLVGQASTMQIMRSRRSESAPSLESIESELATKERAFGGLVHDVPMLEAEWKPVKGEDPRSFKEKQMHGMHFGGDRFCTVAQGCHGYGPAYAKHMQKMLETPLDESKAVAEVGILKGSGLAVWSTMFPKAAIHGFDLDITNTQMNLDFLKKQGAFAKEGPALHTYDQFRNNTALVKAALGDKKLVFVVEDGHHDDVTSLRTFDSFYPSLSGQWLYIVEDAIHYNGQFAKHVTDNYVKTGKVELHREPAGNDVLFFITPKHDSKGTLKAAVDKSGAILSGLSN